MYYEYCNAVFLCCCIQQTLCSRGCSTNTFVINYLSLPFFSNIFKTLSISIRKKLGPEILIECSSPTMCHMSYVRCRVSHVILFSRTKWWSYSGEGLLSMLSTLSTIQARRRHKDIFTKDQLISEWQKCLVNIAHSDNLDIKKIYIFIYKKSPHSPQK